LATIDVERRGRVEIVRMRRPDQGKRVSQLLEVDFVGLMYYAV
jgi:hypothetical protein